MPKVLIALAILLSIGCYNPKKFDVTIEHKSGKIASMQVTVVPKYIKVTIKHKTFVGNKNTKIYKRSLSKEEAISFYNKLNKLNLDTLKSMYTDTLLVGEKTHVIVARKEHNTITSNLINAKTVATDSLIKLIDNLILNSDFKYNYEY